MREYVGDDIPFPCVGSRTFTVDTFTSFAASLMTSSVKNVCGSWLEGKGSVSTYELSLLVTCLWSV